jgi:hypothetical protein
MARGVTFVVCVEPGPHRLEYKAATLFLTMRRNMGALSNEPIRAYAPRPGRSVAPWLRQMMAELEVEYFDEPLNAAHADYPLANKPLALAHAEETAGTEYVVFLDTDILFWREPSRFLLPPQIDVALVPDTTKTTASAGEDDPFELYWQRLYDLVGASARPFVTTTVSRERVRGTWNSGVVPLRRDAGIAGEWRDAMLALLADDFAPPEAAYLRENNLLSAIAAAHFDRCEELPVAYNYPVQAWDRVDASADDAVLWHYQPFFDRAFRRFAARIEAASSLPERMALTEAMVADLRRNYRRRVGVDEPFLRAIRRRLRLGPRVRALLGRSKPTDSNFG